MNQLILAEISQKIHLIVILALLADFLLPKVVSAQNPDLGQMTVIEISANSPEVLFSDQLYVKARPKNNLEPENQPDLDSLGVEKTKPQKTIKLTITAYSSTVDQTDASPCITANGFDVCEHNQEDVVAANFLPFGTKIKIPELYGDKIFTVQDRMHKRYWYHLDLWMQSREKARQFGIEYTTIEIF